MIRNFALMILGIILVVKGILYVAFPWKMKDWMELFIEKSDNLFRIWGLMLLVAGLIAIGLTFISKVLPVLVIKGIL
ncbi:MAG TPA: DUF2065 domain-containing protein [Candidatus Eremiobacteraeota bacterium]|nr:DUF2065 domain-containing protein [Candidatus Eremiobacteraeota bacterium]